VDRGDYGGDAVTEIVGLVKTIVSVTLEVEHDETSTGADVAAKVARVAVAVLNGCAVDEEQLVDIPMHGTKVLAIFHSAADSCACASCGHEQRTMDPCEKCGSMRTVLISVLEESFGSKWRENFDPEKSP
jgi:hypothetical protein